jgi:hypothetical protein
MRYSRFLFGAAFVAAVMAGQAATKSVVGVWKPGIQHGKLSPSEAKTVRAAKVRIATGSLKLHKDKTFGSVLLGQVMFGTYTYDGKVVTLTVKEMVGKTEKEVAKMPASTRIAKLMWKGDKLYSLPLTGSKPQVVWKKVG